MNHTIATPASLFQQVGSQSLPPNHQHFTTALQGSSGSGITSFDKDEKLDAAHPLFRNLGTKAVPDAHGFVSSIKTTSPSPRQQVEEPNQSHLALQYQHSSDKAVAASATETNGAHVLIRSSSDLQAVDQVSP